MKKIITVTALATLAAFSTAHAVDVINWTVQTGTANITNGGTNSPSFDADGISVLGEFAGITLADGQGISFTGSLNINSPNYGDLQVRVGIFDSSVGFGEGIYTSVSNDAAGRNRYTDGSLENPFASGSPPSNTIDLGQFTSDPGGVAPGGILLDYSITLTRNGSLWDMDVSFDNTANGGTFVQAGGTTGLNIAGFEPSTVTFDRAGALFGGSLPAGGTQFDIINAEINVIPEPSVYGPLAGLAGVLLVVMLRKRRHS